MSGKKSGTGNKSGWLTGLMIVSTGLITGFQGFDLAASGNNVGDAQASLPNTALQGRTDPIVPPQSNAPVQQVSVPVPVANALLENKGDGRKARGLANLIEAAQMPAKPVAIVPGVPNEYPVVNRALKQDRAPMPTKGDQQALTSLFQTAKHSPPQAETVSQPLAAPRQRGIAPLVEVSVGPELPYADSADIALFAADMPLPSKLIHNASLGQGVPLVSRSFDGNANSSPLVPRKFVSGKAFGGLAEREFQKRERRCMTTGLYFEARSEPEAGQIAVGQVVMNRVRSPDYPDTICGVIYQGSHRRTGCQFSFTCDGKADKPTSKTQWERSKRLANRVLEGKVWLKSIGHATHYHATYVKPRWRRKMARLKKIGRHIFYKAPKVSVTDTYQRYTNGKRS